MDTFKKKKTTTIVLLSTLLWCAAQGFVSVQVKTQVQVQVHHPKRNPVLIPLQAAADKADKEKEEEEQPEEEDNNKNKKPFELPLTPTEKQKEQLEKFGATPETSMEMLFDKLVDAPDDGSDPTMNAFMSQPGTGGEEWKEFLSNLKDMKEQKKQQQQGGQQEENKKEDEK